MAQYKKRFGVQKPKEVAKPKQAAEQLKPVDTITLVKQAYLRTLSRYPDQREMDRSLKYIEESEGPIDGLRGLLWALLNTKEFIVNH